jgi:hypothetical protein
MPHGWQPLRVVLSPHVRGHRRLELSQAASKFYATPRHLHWKGALV